MAGIPTCDMCDRQFVTKPVRLGERASDSGRIWRACGRCNMMICVECHDELFVTDFSRFNACENSRENRDILDYVGCYSGIAENIDGQYEDEYSDHGWSYAYICQYCWKCVHVPYPNYARTTPQEEYEEHLREHKFIICRSCKVVILNQKQKFEHILDNYKCLDTYMRCDYSLTLKMLVEKITNLQKEISDMKNHETNTEKFVEITPEEDLLKQKESFLNEIHIESERLIRKL